MDARRRSTSRRSTSTSARRCTSRTSATATAASAARRCSGSSAATARPGFELDGRRAARLPARRSWSSRRSPPARTRTRSSAGCGRASSCCAHRSTTSTARTRRCSTPSCSDAAGADAPRSSPRRGASPREGPPDEEVGLEPFAPPEVMPQSAAGSLAMTPLGVTPRGDVPLGRPALRRDRDVRRRPHLALAPRPVHVDHALDPAARGALAEARQPALPPRPARRDRRPRHRHPRPEGAGPTSLGITEDTYRIFSATMGTVAGIGDARRPRDPHRPAAH